MEDASSTWDRASGTYDTLYEQEELANAAADKNSTAVNEINGINKAITDEATELDRLIKVKSDLLAAAGGSISKMDADQINAYGVADKAAARYEADFIARVNDEYTPRLVSANEVYETSKTEYNTAATAYEAAYGTLSERTQEFDDSIKAQLPEIAKAAIADINPNFDPKFYAKQNGIDESEAYQHYMSNGLYNNLPGNQDQADVKFGREVWGAVTAWANSRGLDASKFTANQINFYISETEKAINLSTPPEEMFSNLDVSLIASTFEDARSLTATAITNKLLTDAGFPPQEIGDQLNMDSYAVLAKDTINNQPRQDIDGEFTTGAVFAPNMETGKLEWTNPKDVVTTTWDQERAEFIYNVFKDGTSRPETYDIYGNRLPVDYGEVNIWMDEVPTGLEYLKATNPAAYLEIIAQMDETTVAENKVDPWWVQAAKQVLEKQDRFIKATGGSSGGIEGLATLWSGTLNVIKDISTGVAAGFGVDNPVGTDFYAGLENLIKFADSKLPEEVAANTTAMYKLMSSGKGILGTAEAIFGALQQFPHEFLTQLIMKEGLQEIIPLIIGRGSASMATSAAKTAGYATDVAKIIGSRVGLGAAGLTDVAESYGGSYSSSYTEALAVAKKSGLSGMQAEEKAHEIAATTAFSAATFTLISMGLGGQALEKLFLGSPKGEVAGIFNEITRRIGNGATVFVKESVSEAFEEGATQLVLEDLLYDLDPTRDVLGNVALNFFVGAIVGGPVSGATAFTEGSLDALSAPGEILASFLERYNPKVNIIMNDSETSLEDMEIALSEMGVQGIVQTDLMNRKYDSSFTSSGEATDIFNEFGLPSTQADIEAMVGRTDEDFDLGAAVAAYWADTRGTTADTDGDGINNEDDYAPNDPTEAGNNTAQQEWERALEQAAIDQAAADQAAADQAAADQIESDRLAGIEEGYRH
jgi:hypothetical protein